MTTDEVSEVAACYTSLPLDSADETTTPAEDSAFERGKSIAADGIPHQDVGACVAWHRAGRSGHNPAYPALTGQYADYLALQLQLCQQRRRGGVNAEMMHTIADGLEADQMREVAAYYSSLSSSHANPTD